jgi:hypothetical protein
MEVQCWARFPRMDGWVQELETQNPQRGAVRRERNKISRLPPQARDPPRNQAAANLGLAHPSERGEELLKRVRREVQRVKETSLTATS